MEEDYPHQNRLVCLFNIVEFKNIKEIDNIFEKDEINACFPFFYLVILGILYRYCQKLLYSIIKCSSSKVRTKIMVKICFISSIEYAADSCTVLLH